MRKYCCIHERARSEYCCIRSAGIRADDVAGDGSSDEAGQAEASPAAPNSTASTTRMAAGCRSCLQLQQIPTLPNPADLQALSKLVDPKSSSAELIHSHKCTQFLYQVCQNYPASSPSKYPSACSGGTMSLNINGLALQPWSQVWHPTCISESRHRQGYRA